MVFFEKSRLKRKQGYSDEEIDSFVQYLRNNNMTIDTEEDAIQFIKLQSNLDPSALKKKFTLDERLKPSKSSPMHHLWLEFPEYHNEEEFEPMEYMQENIIETHKMLEKNFYQINDTGESFEKFDQNQQDLQELLEYLNECSATVLQMVKSKFDISSEDAVTEIDKIKYALEHPEEFSDELLNERNLSSVGGFKNSEELEKILNDYVEANMKEQTENENTAELFDDKADASIIVKLSSNKVRAWIYIIPPFNGGKEITEEAVYNALSSNGIVYGIDKFLVERIKKKQMYFKVLEIARGVDPFNGINGKITELFSRDEHRICLKEDEHGNVNFKELGLIKSIHSGEPIAEITLPTLAVDGIQVTGETVKGIDGKYPEINPGTNTVLSEDRTKLLSTIDGEIYFQNDKFHVRKVLVINSDIDAATGNVDFAGNLIINGIIREGFSVKCEGDLQLQGHSEAAEIKVGGNLYMSKGMSGGTVGSIEVEGDMVCRYLENCTVKVKKNLKADQVLNCNIFCEGSVVVSGEKGRIIGGNIFGGKGINAVYIGTTSGAASTTSLTVGMTATYIERKNAYLKELTQIDENIAKLKQNANYLKKLGDNLNSIQQGLMEKMLFQIKVRNFQKSNIEKNISLLTLKIAEKDNKCEITCNTLRPVANINFNGIKHNITQDVHLFKVYSTDDETIFKGSDYEKIIK